MTSRNRANREAAAAAGALPTPRRRPAPRRFTEATRRLIYARDLRRCVRCDINIASCPWSGSVQHRGPCGMGGSTVPWRQRPANGILLCGSGTTGCHGWVEAHPPAGERYGWSLPDGDTMTADRWPVLYPAFGEVRLLDDHGDFTVVATLDDLELERALADFEYPDPQFTVGVFAVALP